MSYIELNDVSFTYRSQRDETALDGVSCAIDCGEVVGIAGPTDAGKSTLCRLLAGYIPSLFDGLVTGTATVGDVEVTDPTVERLVDDVGVVFENPFDQLSGTTTTVRQEVAFGPENVGLPREEIETRVSEALLKVGIEQLADRNPRALSGGQVQRLAIASMLAMQPKTLIFDEPTSQLDPTGTEEVFEVIDDMRDMGYTVVVVSHDIDRLAATVDRLLLFSDSKLLLDGAPEEVLTADRSIDRYVQIPDPIRCGTQLREWGMVAPNDDVPLTVEGAIAEIEPLVDSDRFGESTRTDETCRDSAAESIVKLTDVVYEYDGCVRALCGVSLALDRDDRCVCLIGQNGAGKSTLIKHFNGLLQPTTGTVQVRGVETSEASVADLARDVGISFQNPDDQLFHSSIEAEVRYGPENLQYEQSRIDALAERELERLDLLDVRHENPYDVGYQTRKRVAIASVLAMDTPVVVLDEPTGGLDAPSKTILGEAIADLSDAGKVVVVVTHDMDFAGEHADRVVVLAEGEVLADGDPRAVFGRLDALERADVRPPSSGWIGHQLGADSSFLSVEELLEAIGQSRRSVL